MSALLGACRASPPPPASPVQANAGDADVVFVQALDEGASWTFLVSVHHLDLSWQDYADGWDVLLPDGTVIKPDPGSPFTRLLLHPHVGEQPFTRSQVGIKIPAGTAQVRVRAHDIVSGWGGREVWVELNGETAGEGYQVQHRWREGVE